MICGFVKRKFPQKIILQSAKRVAVYCITIHIGRFTESL